MESPPAQGAPPGLLPSLVPTLPTRPSGEETGTANGNHSLRVQNACLIRLATDKTLVAGDLAAAARSVTETAAQALDVDRCSLWLLTPDRSELVCLDGFRRSNRSHSQGGRIQIALHPAYAEAISVDRILAVRDVHTDPIARNVGDCLPPGPQHPAEVTSLLDVPIRRGQVTVGILRHQHAGPPRDWTLDEIQLATAIADLVALALEARDRVEAEDRLRLHNRVLQGVRFAAQRLLAAEDWREAIHDVLAAIGQATDASRVSVFECHGGEGPQRRHTLRHEWSAAGIESTLGNPMLIEVDATALGFADWMNLLESGQPVSRETELLSPAKRAILDPLGIKSIVLAPVMSGGRWWGWIGLEECRRSRRWSPSETDTLQAAADSLGSAIERQAAKLALIAAKEAAEAANRAKSQFLANMSHEIRTPITGVMGMLQLLQRTTLQSRQSRYVASALSSAETLLAVLGDVLDFSKIEANRLELERTAFLLGDHLEATLRLMAEKAERKGIELACRVADTVPAEVFGDPHRLRQILLNLLGNAIKFTDRGEIVVGCTLVERNGDDILLRFEVRDTGRGIAPEHQRHIFDAFFQADNSMARAYGGTGLGLAISRQLTQLMGGQIGVDSRPDCGSTFWFTARLRATPNDAAQTPGWPVSLSNLHVLIVDDCAITREIVAEHLASWGGRPSAAANAADAIQALRNFARTGDPVAVAILDWRMPGEDGVALARTIRQDAELRSTGLVLLSSFAHQSEASDLEHAGFAATLPKPPRRSDLYNAVVTAANDRLHRPPPPPEPAPTGEPAPLPTGHGTLVLAEDNDINQEVACELLTSMGYTCRCVRNGYEAVRAVENGRVDLVLMDCQMPGMDGYEATRRIRDWERRNAGACATSGPSTPGAPEPIPHIPIIALTAHAMSGDRDRCLEAGMDDYLTKPLDPASIARTVQRFLDHAPQASPAPPVPAGGASASEPEPLIDRKSLLRRCLDRPELAHRLLVKFERQAHQDLWDLGEALGQADAPRLRATAHRLKGAAANVSVESIRALAHHLEHAGAAGDLSTAAPLLRELDLRINAFTAELARDSAGTECASTPGSNGHQGSSPGK